MKSTCLLPLVLILLLAACGGGTPTPTPTPTPIPTPVTPTPIPTPVPPTTPTPTPPTSPSNTLEFGNIVTYSRGDTSYIIGTVKNNSSTNAEFLKLVATLYDASGNFLGSDFTYSELDIVKPGETTPFKMYITDFISFETFDITAEARSTSEEPYRPIISNLRLQDNRYSTTVTGQVTNTASVTLEFVKVVFTCYRNGTLADVDFTYSDLDMVPANGISPFTSYITSPYKDPEQCQAVAQGQNY